MTHLPFHAGSIGINLFELREGTGSALGISYYDGGAHFDFPSSIAVLSMDRSIH